MLFPDPVPAILVDGWCLCCVGANEPPHKIAAAVVHNLGFFDAPPSLRSNVEVTFPSESLATIACNTLAVDAELQPDKIVRTLRVEGSSLLA